MEEKADRIEQKLIKIESVNDYEEVKMDNRQLVPVGGG
jgi:hypothetical protein